MKPKQTKNGRSTLTETVINKTQLNISQSGSCFFNRTARYKMPPVPFGRLYYHIDGEMSVFFNEKLITFKKNHVYLLGPNSVFPIIRNASTEQMYFHVNLYDTKGFDILNNYITCDGIPVDDMPGILEMYYSKDTLDTLTLKQIILSDCIKLLKKSKKENQFNIVNENYSEKTREAINYIRDNLSLKLTVQNIADHLFVSANTIDYHFKKETNKTVSQYVHLLVNLKARELLINTNLSIKEIAEELGFCDQFHFSKRFKKRFKKSPSEYRKTFIENDYRPNG